jgi:hypothetical protein
MNILKIVAKAKTSGFYRKILNFGLNRMVPFNRPHGFKIIEIGDYKLKTLVPFKKANFNHIRGIHACALATLSEFTTGFLLLSKLDPKKYRLILQNLSMDYHYQAKMNAYGNFIISEDWLEKMIYIPLESTDKVLVECEVKIHDAKDNHLSTGVVIWQIKSWEKVNTKV